MKLRTKIQLFSSLVILTLILIVNASVYFVFYKMSTNSELEELELITSDFVNAFNQNPDVEPGELMRAYLPANGMIRIISEGDKPIIEQTRSKAYLSLPVNYSNSETRKIVTQESAPDIAVIEKPIIWPAGSFQGDIVTIQVSNHLISLHETMRTLLYILGILSFIALIPVVLSASILSRFLLKPIRHLISTMKENINQGKWQTLEVKRQSRDEMYEMQQTFNEMINQLKMNYEKQEMFVSDASHELKTPIQIIKSYAQLLERRDHVPPEVFKESILAIDSEADRMNKLIGQMLSLAKDKQINQWEAVPLLDVVEETVATFQGVSHRKIQVIADDPDLSVKGNKDQLEQVVYILIDNAMKYSEKEVEVHLFQKDGFVYLQVKDYGPGIAREEQNRIFDRFYRIDKARGRNTGGTGLGLSIAKSIAEAHGAKLTLESESGEGSIFTLRIAKHS